MLQAFENIEPGLANRLVRMAEKDQDHEHARSLQELVLVGKQQAIVSRSQISGAVISLAGLLCGTVLILCGATTTGVVAVLAQASATFIAVLRSRKPLGAKTDDREADQRNSKAIVPVNQRSSNK